MYGLKRFWKNKRRKLTEFTLFLMRNPNLARVRKNNKMHERLVGSRRRLFARKIRENRQAGGGDAAPRAFAIKTLSKEPRDERNDAMVEEERVYSSM